MSQASQKARAERTIPDKTEASYPAPATKAAVVVEPIAKAEAATISPTAPLSTMKQAQENPPPPPNPPQ